MSTKLNVCRWTLLALVLVCHFVSQAQGYCSLDEMKLKAVEACERLYQQDEGRARRSIDYNGHHNKISHNKHHKAEHIIGQSTYPKGGYLKVSTHHFNRLIELDILPRYKPRKQHMDKKMRFKRDHGDQRYNNISYCCYHTCNDEFFC